VERGLVDDVTGEDRRAVAGVAQREPVEQHGPAAVEVALDADLVTSGAVARVVVDVPHVARLLAADSAYDLDARK
jgi:hypothetical protein